MNNSVIGDYTSGWRLKRQTNGDAITVYGQKPMLGLLLVLFTSGALSDPVPFDSVIGGETTGVHGFKPQPGQAWNTVGLFHETSWCVEKEYKLIECGVFTGDR